MTITRDDNTGEVFCWSGKFEYYIPMSYADYKKLKFLIEVKGWDTGRCWVFIKKRYKDKIIRRDEYERRQIEHEEKFELPEYLKRKQ